MATLGANAPEPADPLSHLTPGDHFLLARFLVLIRDNYRKADKAAHFLERRAGVANTCGITNLRDVLSHLATLLDPNTPEEKRRDQIGNAEEHLRRAIVEPYEIGLANLTEKFTPAYDTYRERVVPIRAQEGFRSAPDRPQVEGRLADINENAQRGKIAKGRNLWDQEWEDGIAGFVEAFDRLTELHHEIEEWNYKAEQHHQGRHGISLHRRAIALAIAAIVIGLIGGIVIARYTPLLELHHSVTQPAIINPPAKQ